jgi:hypothetical protein
MMIWEPPKSSMIEDHDMNYHCSVCCEEVPPQVPRFIFGWWSYCPICISLWTKPPEGTMGIWWIRSWLHSLAAVIEQFEDKRGADRYKRRAARYARKIGLLVEGPIEYALPPITFEELGVPGSTRQGRPR